MSDLYSEWIEKASGQKGQFITKDGKVIFVGGPGGGGGGVGSSGMRKPTFGAEQFAEKVGARILEDVSDPNGNRSVELEVDNPEKALRPLYDTWTQMHSDAVINVSPFKFNGEMAGFTAELLNDVNDRFSGYHNLILTAQTPAYTQRFAESYE